MGATIHEIARTTENTADKAQDTNSHAAKGMEQVAATVAQVQQLSARLADAAGTAAQLDADSVTIGSGAGSDPHHCRSNQFAGAKRSHRSGPRW